LNNNCNYGINTFAGKLIDHVWNFQDQMDQKSSKQNFNYDRAWIDLVSGRTADQHDAISGEIKNVRIGI